jgi:hypothetical protein
MYEDFEIERRAFQGKGRVFCIASAGSTAMALSASHEVVACDINPVQLEYAQRRAAGGAAEVGDAERAMAFARAFMPLIGWRANVVRKFLALSDVDEQVTFWREHLNTRRFRLSFDAMISPAILRFVYAREFLACLPPRFGAVLRARLERNFGRHANAGNPFVRGLFLGEHAEVTRAGKVQFVLGDAAGYLESCEAGYFDAFTLSNILDGASDSYRDRLFCAVRHAASDGAIVVLRSFGEPPPELTVNYAAEDRAMLWGLVEVKRATQILRPRPR